MNLKLKFDMLTFTFSGKSKLENLHNFLGGFFFGLSFIYAYVSN